MTETKLQPPQKPEEDQLISGIKHIGPEIVSFTAGKNDVALPNSASAFAPYGEDGRLILIYKEQGSAKIGPEFVIQDQYVEDDRLKSISFSWPEQYPDDRSTWRLTLVDSSLPKNERRKDIQGAGMRDEYIEQALSLVRKTEAVLADG